MAKTDGKTLVEKLLDGKKIAYEAYTYEVDSRDAVVVAEAVGFRPAEVFKTLVVQPPDSQPKSKWMLVMIPADQQLDLKKLAKAVGAKKLKMATHQEAEQVTGLQVGGISALALLNKGFAVCLDESARPLAQIVLSAGQRGKQVRLAVSDLVKLTRARWVDAVA